MASTSSSSSLAKGHTSPSKVSRLSQLYPCKSGTTATVLLASYIDMTSRCRRRLAEHMTLNLCRARCTVWEISPIFLLHCLHHFPQLRL
jgi:hypothetical protein